MAPALARAYDQLDRARRAVIDPLDPGTVAHLEQHGAGARAALADYGIDLDEPAHRDAVMAVGHLLASGLSRVGPAGVLAALSDVQQALIAATRTHPHHTEENP